MKLRLFTAIAFIAMAMISCTEDTDTIGSSITNDTDRLLFSTGVYNATSRSILADSVYSHNSDCYFGMVKDPETNTYVKSDIMAQFNMIEGFKLPSEDKMLSKIDGEVVADSCYISLYVKYSKSYGDTLNAMKMRVSELNAPIDDKYTHYSNFDLKKNGYIRNDGLKINKMFTVRDLKLSDGNLYSLQHNIPYQGTSSDSGYYDRIHIPMNVPYTAKDGRSYNNYGTYVMRTYYEHPEYFTNSYRFVHNVCPGFNFEITDGLGVMANIMEIDIQMFYSFITSADTTAYTSVYLSSTPEVLQTAHIVNDRKALEELVNDNSCTYLKSPAGIFTEVTLPVDEISQAHANDSLLSVSINFSRQNSDVETTNPISTPSSILMVHKDSLYSFFENKTMYDYKSSFYAALSSTNNYSFNSIGNIITLMAQQKAEGLKTDPDWVAKHPDWNKVVLVPISTTVKYSSDYYGNTTSTVSAVGNQLGLSSTKLVGGPNSPIEVKVIYAKFND
ncbi:MAG: DUF4270 domain-containing protein [Prevotella ruminicola]|uniref:DUF4270 domain-containing protein n=1 Tax=Xylanibacter ruminicola TaxID=839 RepID=A0A928GH49_XYLRU|nr:DUF4270 domain-containing protein [Xylanibacter ruminicola]